VKVQMMGMLGKLAITPMGFLAAGYSVLAWEGRVLEEEIANTMGFITVGILAETMATMVTIMLVAFLQIIIHLLGLDIVMAGMLLVLLGSPSFSSGWSRRQPRLLLVNWLEDLSFCSRPGSSMCRSNQRRAVPTVVRQLGLVRPPPAPAQNSGTLQGQQQTTAQRAEDVLLAVAGCATNDLVNDNLTEDEFVVTTKNKRPSFFRCHKVGHFLNDCEAVLCDCCQRP
jgi:hypothetical protein